MLVRALLAIENPADAKRVRSLLGGPGVLLTTMATETTLWEGTGSEPFDLLVTDRGVLPEPAAEAVRVIRDFPASPDVIVISARENAEDRAELLAAGCVAVLPLDLGDDALRATRGSAWSQERKISGWGTSSPRAPP
jgi:CheY-like chemotaxis protein